MKRRFTISSPLLPYSVKLLLVHVSLVLLSSLAYAIPPVINAINPTTGNVGSTVTITGTNFSTTATNNTVYFGAVKATVTSASTTSLTVTVPSGATYAPVTVTTTDGYAASPTYFIPMFAGGGKMYPNTMDAPIYLTVDDRGIVHVATGDIDGDGKPDIIGTNSYNGVLAQDSNQIVIYRNTSASPTLNFASAIYLRTGTVSISPQDLIIADVDNDGKLDIVYGSPTQIYIWRNTSTAGNISFAPVVSPGNTASKSIAVADLDRDGKPDIVNLKTASSLEVCLNTSTPGNISFGTPTVVVPVMAAMTNEIKAEDLDSDSYPDIVCASESQLYVYKNNFATTPFSFTNAFQSIHSAFRVTIGDIDMDGKPDLLTHTSGTVYRKLLNTSTAGTMSFALSTGTFDSSYNSARPSLADINGDGKPDMILVTSAQYQTGTAIKVALNTSATGNPSFGPLATYHFGPQNLTQATACDFDGDAKPDLVGAALTINTSPVYRNVMGKPTITSFTPTSAGNTNEVTIKGGYFNGATAVSFGSVAASSFTVTSDTTIAAIVGSGASGAVSVTTPKGSFSLAGFSYLLSPVITSFTPALAQAGQTVTITGTYFANTTQVSFGGVPATSFTVVSATSLTAVVGAGASGNVSVTNTAGTGTKAGFTLLSTPIISSIIPANGPLGTSITLTGTHFGNSIADNKVFFGSTAATITAASSNSITATVPTGAIYRPIRLTTNYLTTQSALPFNVTFTGDLAFNAATFSRDQDLAVPGFISAASADFDGDGKYDLASTVSGSLIIHANTTIPGDTTSFVQSSFAVNTTTEYIAIGDLNGDGKEDIVLVRNTNSVNSLIVMRNTSTPGNISFTRDNTVLYPAYTPAAAAIADIDGDGRQDIISTNETGAFFTVIRSIGLNGAFAYASPQHFAVQNSAVGIRVITGKFNNDDKPDIVLLTNLGISTFVNNSTPGNLQFGPQQQYIAGATNKAITAGDVNNDGITDLVVTYINSAAASKVGIMTTSRTGTDFTLSAITELSALKEPLDVVLDDFNGDAKPDILISNKNTHTVSIYRNTYNGSAVTFDPYQSYPVGTSPLFVMAADFNNDGKVDICASNKSSNSLTVLLNKNGAAFLSGISPKTGGPGTTVTLTGTNLVNVTGVYFGGTPAQSYTVVSPTTITAVTGSGSDGLVTVTTSTSQVTISDFTFLKPSITSFTPASGAPGTTVTITGTNFNAVPENTTVYFGAVKATVTSATTTSLTVVVPQGATYAPISVTCFGATAYSGTPFMVTFDGAPGLDSASFSPNVLLSPNLNSGAGMVLGDFTNDGKPDLAALQGSTYIYLNTGSADHAYEGSPIMIAGSDGSDIAVADVNADNKLDLIVGGVGVIKVYLNTSNESTLSFTPMSFTTNLTTAIVRLVVADFDQDAKPDIAMIHANGTTLSFLRNTSTYQALNFAAMAGPATPGINPKDIVAMDLNNDGKAELVVTDYRNTKAFAYRNTSTTTISFAAGTTLSIDGYSFAAAAGDLDSDGKPDIVISKLKQNARTAFAVFKNNSTTGGNLAFVASGEYPLEYEAYGLTLSDINGDGKPEVLAANGTYNGRVSIFLNTSISGFATFGSGVNFSVGTEPVRIIAGDLNGDSKPDVITANRRSNLYTSGPGFYILYNQLTAAAPVQPGNLRVIEFKAGPNPFESSLTVKLETAVEDAKLQLVNSSGTVVQTWQYKNLPSGSAVNISKAELRPGFYFLVLQAKQGRKVLQIIKQ